MPFNPSFRPQVPPFPWSPRGNRILDANGKTVCVFFDVSDPAWFAERICQFFNDKRHEIFEPKDNK